MSFIIGNEHIKNQLINSQFENAMNITSFLTDGIVFSLGEELPNTEWKNQWLKYCKIIMPSPGYRIEYTNTYKSDKLKGITQYDIFRGDDFIVGGVTHSYVDAQAQAYIKLSQIGNFNKVIEDGLPKLQWIIGKIPDYFYRIESSNRHYRIRDDLKRIVNDKSLLREWKLSLIDI